MIVWEIRVKLFDKKHSILVYDRLQAIHALELLLNNVLL